MSSRLNLWTRLVLFLVVLVSTPAIRADDGPAPRIEHNVAVPMRDGTVLRADVYRPAGPGPFPVLVCRTPYGKQGTRPDHFVAAGYIVVVQDTRGRYASEGTFESFVRAETHDGTDGYDTVEWAAKLPGATGKVGTFGVSYNSFLQWRLAPLRPPSLVAMSAHSIPARYTDLEGPGTIRPGRRLKWWATTLAPDMRRRAGRPGPHTVKEALPLWEAGEGANLLRFLPWSELPDRVFEDEAVPARAWLAHPERDPWRLDEGCKEIAVPNLDVVGWYDNCHGDFRLFTTMAREGKTATARAGQRIVIGPWPHTPHGTRKFGAIDFGPNAVVDIRALEIRWFDHWLKGSANGVDRDAPVRFFLMGTNEWREAPAWPVPGTRPATFYLAGGKANTAAGNGALVTSVPRAGTDGYRYDPRDPVPSLYGSATFTVAADQRPLANRHDILVYQTPPLAQALEVIGNPEVELYAASSAPDTDFFARLIDVAPDGLARDVSVGMVRARYRGGLTKPALLTPGEVTKFTLRLGPTANRFLPGHRLRLDVTSSDFPNYDRNHNTAADQNADAELRSAVQTVHFGGARASKLVLPVTGAPSAAGEPVPPEGYPAPGRNRKDEPLARELSFDGAAAFLDASAVNWTASRKCFTCHTNLSYLLARPMISPVASGKSPAHDYVRGSLESIVLDRWKTRGPRWPTEVVTAGTFLAFNDAHTTGKLHPASRQALDRMWTVQRADGSWKWLHCDYPPMEIDDHYGVTIAAIGAGVAPDGYADTPQARAGLAKIKAYLAANPGEFLHHRAMVLWASSYLPRLGLMTKAEHDRCVADLLARQLPDGGWSAAALGEWDRQDGLPQDAKAGDGYGTGFVVYVLRRAGLPASDPRLQKGIAWIKTHQRASGRWFTPSLVRDGEHYLTQAGTAYACMALYACGETPVK